MQGALCLQLYLEIVKILYLPLTGVPVKNCTVCTWNCAMTMYSEQ